MTDPAPVTAPEEHVLVVPTADFHEVGLFHGYTTDIIPYLSCLLHAGVVSYRPRSAVETDPSFKQLIPYCVFRCKGKIFSYRRGSSSGESRLHAKRSIGVGGHISAADGRGSKFYDIAMMRELREEVDIQSGYDQECVGLINDDSNDVGRVHLGVVHVFELHEPRLTTKEAALVDGKFEDLADLLANKEEFETWSQICFDLIAEYDQFVDNPDN